ncbi:hypothetical protein GQ42DRAFT_80222 [Ramicandelaber brevisporus]|nr:hypothetical protein GQ42DRAFT_80222 [Ramicandelaber brevisporus]
MTPLPPAWLLITGTPRLCQFSQQLLPIGLMIRFVRVHDPHLETMKAATATSTATSTASVAERPKRKQPLNATTAAVPDALLPSNFAWKRPGLAQYLQCRKAVVHEFAMQPSPVFRGWGSNVYFRDDMADHVQALMVMAVLLELREVIKKHPSTVSTQIPNDSTLSLSLTIPAMHTSNMIPEKDAHLIEQLDNRNYQSLYSAIRRHLSSGEHSTIGFDKDASSEPFLQFDGRVLTNGSSALTHALRSILNLCQNDQVVTTVYFKHSTLAANVAYLLQRLCCYLH